MSTPVSSGLTNTHHPGHYAWVVSINRRHDDLERCWVLCITLLCGLCGDYVMFCVPGERDNVPIIVLCDYRLLFHFPNNKLPVSPSARKECTIGGAGKVRHIPRMSASKGLMSFRFRLVENSGIYSLSAPHRPSIAPRPVTRPSSSCRSLSYQGPPIWMAGNLRAGLRLRIHSLDNHSPSSPAPVPQY
ncbi:hypothetical protein L873DRAFT_363354 [Choiromyces venosus 120613-1]|uniref:Uncharacterized protein n=1 Tax=Choiromyces venosus 120613-1 TaxID=1336337 RepID=A0A3N4JZP0_9PEZI|nr:hypothetical protein L873DRAFT_363354 [Choiromyces venosus 120613-1]